MILPARNGGDLEDVPEEVRDEMTFHLVERVGEVLEVALAAPAAGPRAQAESLPEVA